MAPLTSEPSDDPPQPADEGLARAQLRKKAMSEVEAVFAGLLAFATAKPAPRVSVLCEKVEALADSGQKLTPTLHRAFDDAEIFALIRGEVLAGPLDMLAKIAEKACDDRGGTAAARKSLVDGLESALAQVQRTFAEIARFDPERYQPKSVLEFKPFDLSAFPTKQKWLSFGFEQGMALGNSSTNFNRKRSAYVLKRFFCDDLIPVGFESPQEHVGGAHGSKTSCFACHHKLDPMAGFFRSYGAYFFDYSRSPDIIFDDLANKSLARYTSVWKARRKEQPAWNVGYIRSARYQSYNSYGTSIADLSRILRTAPEVKRCLVKRLHEYLVAEDQTIDGGYLDYLTREFEAEAVVNSSTAVKNTIVRILESAAYEQRNADSKRCYDAAPGSVASEGPPCRVAFILSKNCAQCHHVGGDDAAARLDVGAWIPAPEGRGHVFRHVDASMMQLSARESLARVVERLSSYETSTRMPKGRVMPSDERQELFLWAQEELGRMPAQQAAP
jgi:mono/diheme cytochrome c family protein